MNEKEAREIVAYFKRLWPGESVRKEKAQASSDGHRYFQAIGYLSALDKAKGLEEAIKKCSKEHGGCYYTEKALAKWEEEK